MAGIEDYDLMLTEGLFDVDYGIKYTDITHEFYLLVESVTGAFGEYRQTLIEFPKETNDDRIAIHSRVFPKLKFWVLETDIAEPTDLSAYLTKLEAEGRYQPKGDYLVQSQTDSWYQPKGNYLTQWAADNSYQAKGDYLTKNLGDTYYQPKGNYLTQWSADQSYQPKGNYLTQYQADNYYQPKGNYLTKYQADTSYQPKGDYATKSDIANAVGRTMVTVPALPQPTSTIYGDPVVKVMGGVAYVNFTLKIGKLVTAGYSVFSFKTPANNYVTRTEQRITAPMTDKSGFVHLKFVVLSESNGAAHMGVIADQQIVAGTTLQFNFAMPLVTK